jgi:hypothetical protein
MMLNAVALKSSRAPIIHMHWQGHSDGALWKHQPFAIILIDAQVIGDDLELITRHSKHVVVVNTHEINLQVRPVGRQMQLLFALGKWSRQLRKLSRVNLETIRELTPKAATA